MIESQKRRLARGIARAFLAGNWEGGALLSRATESVGATEAWLRALVRDTLAAHPAAPDGVEALGELVLQHQPFRDACDRRRLTGLRRWFFETPFMAQAPWPVRRLATLADVAGWLALSPEQLEWFADRKGWEHRSTQPRLWNFMYRWVPKRSGGARLLEAPKSNLKRVQRRILREVLDHIVPHPAAHGFRRGHSALSHARLHTGKKAVVRLDLRDFFASVHTGRCLGIFRAAGYPEQVAKTLVGLCTNRTPMVVLAKALRPTCAAQVTTSFDLRRALAGPHLPQGSPTSPALANLVAYGLDVRLARFAEALGATYSRYADDLTFSGDAELARCAPRLERYVHEVVRDEGFAVNPGKTRVMASAQRQVVTGVVVNGAGNVRRDEFDALKARLHNLRARGPAGEVEKRELEGRVAWVEAVNVRRGARLRAELEGVA